MANTKDKGNISIKGGGTLKVQQVNDDGSQLTTPGTVIDLGYIETSGIQLVTSGDKTVYDETGDAVFYDEGEVSVKVTGSFLQSNKDLLDFLRDSTSGKFYQVYLKMTRKNEMNGKTQELFGAIGRIKKQFDVKAGTKKIPFEINLLRNETAITITTPTTTWGCAATAVIIGAGNSYEIEETAETT